MKYRRSCNHSDRQLITSDKWGHHLKGQRITGTIYQQMRFLTFNKGQGRGVESSTLFPPFETNVLPTTTHHLLHLAKHMQTHSPSAADKTQSR